MTLPGTLYMGLDQLDKQAGMIDGAVKFGKGAMGLIPKVYNTSKSLIKGNPKSLLHQPIRTAWKSEPVQKGIGRATKLGGAALTASLGVGLAQKAFTDDAVSQAHIQQAGDEAYLATHGAIGDKLQQAGFFGGLAQQFDPSMIYKPISEATGAQMPVQQHQPTYNRQIRQTPSTAAQTYNQTFRHF